MVLDAGCWHCPTCDIDGIRQLMVDAVGSSDPEESAADFAFWMKEKNDIISNVTRTKEALDQIQEYFQDNYGAGDEDLVIELEKEFGDDFCVYFGELGEAITELHETVCLTVSDSSLSSLDTKDAITWLKSDLTSANLPVIKYPNRIFFTETNSNDEDFCFGSYILSFDLLLIMDEKDLEALEALKP
jgi:hypothetical protein